MITDFSKVTEILNGTESGYFNMDCMEGMKIFPNKFFDLAIVDPPYGEGLADSGGCKGWFTKYHQKPESPENMGGVARKAEVPLCITDHCDSMVGTDGINISRTGGTWAKKYGKK